MPKKSSSSSSGSSSRNDVIQGFFKMLLKRLESHKQRFGGGGEDPANYAGLQVYCLVAATCMLSQDSTLAEVCMSYALLLIHEITSCEAAQDQHGTQAEELLLNSTVAGSTWVSLPEFVAKAVKLQIACKAKFQRNLAAPAAEPLQFSSSIQKDEDLLLTGFWDTMTQTYPNQKKEMRKVLSQLTRDILAQAAEKETVDERNHVRSLVAAEKMSWSTILGSSSNDSSEGKGGVRWCMKKIVSETMSQVLAMATLDDSSSSGGGRLLQPPTACLPLPPPMMAVVCADVFVRVPDSRTSFEVHYETTTNGKKGKTIMKIDRNLLNSVALPPQQQQQPRPPAFSIQYGIHFMLIHAQKEDWSSSNSSRLHSSSIFHPSRINQMSASMVLALARVDCPLPKSFLDEAILDSTVELHLLNSSKNRSSMNYTILPYVVWKAVLCTPDMPPPSDSASLFTPRHLITATNNKNNKEETLRFEDEWLNLQLEENVSFDLFLAIHKLLVENYEDTKGITSKVGFFAMMKTSTEDEWDDGIIVHEVHAKRKTKDVVFYEALYRSGRVAWHEEGKDINNLDNAEDNIAYCYETIEEYLRACNTNLPKWAGRFQHGKGSASNEADAAFLKDWREYYGI